MKIRKIFTLSLLLFAGITLLYCQPVKDHGKLSVKGTQLVDEKGKTVILRGVSYGWHNWWPRFYNKETVKWLRDDWGCTGMSANGDGPINYDAWHTWIDWMQSNNLSMVFWSIADKNETCSMLTKDASSQYSNIFTIFTLELL